MYKRIFFKCQGPNAIVTTEAEQTRQGHWVLLPVYSTFGKFIPKPRIVLFSNFLLSPLIKWIP